MPRKEPLSEWEKDLLAEQATLVTLCQTWHIFCQVSKEELEKHGRYLDPELVFCLKKVLKKVMSMTYVGAKLEVDGAVHDVLSLSHALAEVNDEIKALNPGLPTRKGIKYENGGTDEKDKAP